MADRDKQGGADEIEITEEMIEAGANELSCALDDHLSSSYPFELLAGTVFRRMAALSSCACKLGEGLQDQFAMRPIPLIAGEVSNVLSDLAEDEAYFGQSAAVPFDETA